MQEDSHLIGMVQRKATGASIHDVNGMIGYYRAAIECLQRPAENPEQETLARNMHDRAVRVFHDFLSHGDIQKAKADNPAPKIPH
jgi:hypothetical protein